MQRSLHRIGGSNNGSSELLRTYDGKIAGLYDLEETLGRGHFAVVKLARHVFTGEKVAVKVIDKSKLDDVSKAHLFQEVRCMKLVQHPNVVRLYEVIDTATKLYLILELGDGGDLYEYIIRHDQGLPEDKAKDYFRQIVRAIAYCHQLHVVHRDLKPENVVFFKKLGIVKLTDFGFSNKFYPGQKLETSCGSLAYSAPEILLGDSYDAPAVDVWSLGVILYMLVCGQAPFQEANDSETLTMIMDCKYNVPEHVSTECRDLISKMLIRNPEKRATLHVISTHPWLGSTDDDDDAATDTLAIPLISKENLSEDDHNLIVQKIVNGNIATKEEVQECLDKNEYNHITATYYLLAERKLRAKRVDVANKKRPENLAVSKSLGPPQRDPNTPTTPSLLNVPRTPGDLPPRSRKCSIVQEDEEEEDDDISGRDDAPLNRRGSKSEGRLNLALQERLAESEHKLKQSDKSDIPQTITITDSSTITIPIITTSGASLVDVPTYKTMPSPSPNALNEIFEEGPSSSSSSSPSRFVKRTPYEQRRSKFHKSRTASCSSSDASDDDSEKRKKRAHKLQPTPTKPIQGRRDSYDDSSDSQEPGSGTTTNNERPLGGSSSTITESSGGSSSSTSTNNADQTEKSGTTNSEGGRKTTTIRHHKPSRRRRSGETRLRESQSLNRITEVQEDSSHQLVISTTTATMIAPKVKGIGARILQAMSTKKAPPVPPPVMVVLEHDKSVHVSRKDTIKNQQNDDDKDTKKKMRILGKYFHVHKKLFIPLPMIFTKNSRLYKAQSCGSLVRDKINKAEPVLRCRQRAVSVFRNSLNVEREDINQNKDARRKSATVVQLNNVCNELTGMCAIHLGQTSKCSFC